MFTALGRCFAVGFETRQSERNLHACHALHIAASEPPVQNQTDRICHSGKFSWRHSPVTISSATFSRSSSYIYGPRSITDSNTNTTLLPDMRWCRGAVVKRRTCDQEVVGTLLRWAYGIKPLGKFLTLMCLCHQAVLSWYWAKGGDAQWLAR